MENKEKNHFYLTTTTATITTIEEKRRTLLDSYRQKQPFRVSIGKSKWINYESFNPSYNLREILNDEIVIEFDCEDWKITTQATHDTGINLWNAGYRFEWWDHGGRSPHLHIHDLPIGHLDSNKRSLFKKIFIRKYVPLEFLKFVDFSLTGIHLLAIEYQNHWKGKYGVKKLISVFDGKNKNSWSGESDDHTLSLMKEQGSINSPVNHTHQSEEVNKI